METSGSSWPDLVAMVELVLMATATEEEPKPHDTKLSPAWA
jgi:hypothetical protein